MEEGKRPLHRPQPSEPVADRRLLHQGRSDRPVCRSFPQEEMTPPSTSQADVQRLLEDLDHAAILKAITLICGAAIDDGTIVHLKGGCGKEVNAYDAYRCVDCTASFHRDCMREHLKGETEKD